MAADPAFWRGRRVLLTGHTGFKGSWAARWLTDMGAVVIGAALAPATEPAMFDLIETGAAADPCDLTDRDAATMLVDTKPEILLHFAAQPLVRESYRTPVETFQANVMGTVHLLDAMRACSSLKTAMIITTDKVYQNDDAGRAFREDDPLGGHDPYAASKAAAEIAVQSYRKSFYADAGIRLATVRGGNVIGGGDFSDDRLIPDIIRAMRAGHPVELRNPNATRPWQHVLDCLDGYFTYAQALNSGADVPLALNIGPHDPADTLTVDRGMASMARALGIPSETTRSTADHPHEMAHLALDPTAARQHLGWQGRMTSARAIQLTADWYAAWTNGADMTRFTQAQIADYQAGKENTP